MAVDPAKTYHGRPCKLGHTLRWKSCHKCVACTRRDARVRMARRHNLDHTAERMRAYREDHIYRYGEQLRSRRYKALRRREARNGQV